MGNLLDPAGYINYLARDSSLTNDPRVLFGIRHADDVG